MGLQDNFTGHINIMEITVIMPIKAINRFLPIALNSLEIQSLKSFNLLIVCPKSEYSNISNYLTSLNLSFPHHIIPLTLGGFTFAINTGLNYSTTEFIARLDSDDFSDPLRFQRQIEEFKRDPSLAIVGTRGVIVDENGQKDSIHNFKFYETSNEIRRALKYRQPLLHSSLMFRRSILLSNNGYLYGLSSEDHELFIRIARDKSLKFKNIGDVTTSYRRHSEQLSDIKNSKKQFYEVSGFLFSEFLRTFDIMYIIGIVANIPLFRSFRFFYRHLKKNYKF